jgi:hypothetical protein
MGKCQALSFKPSSANSLAKAPSTYNCDGIVGREGLHCLSRDESRRAYEASHLG